MARRAAPIHIRVNGPGGWYQTLAPENEQSSNYPAALQRGRTSGQAVPVAPAIVSARRRS
jgi:hypothetical protein